MHFQTRNNVLTNVDLLHESHQFAETVHHVVLHILRGVAPIHFVKELAGALDLCLLDRRSSMEDIEPLVSATKYTCLTVPSLKAMAQSGL